MEFRLTTCLASIACDHLSQLLTTMGDTQVPDPRNLLSRQDKIGRFSVKFSNLKGYDWCFNWGSGEGGLRGIGKDYGMQIWNNTHYTWKGFWAEVLLVALSLEEIRGQENQVETSM